VAGWEGDGVYFVRFRVVGRHCRGILLSRAS
jgi:hypothetical protein